MVCAVGLLPAVVVNVKPPGLSVICGGAIAMVTGIVAGLPAATLPVIASTAVIVTLVVYDEPPAKPAALALTLIGVLVPPTRLVPVTAESEIKLGAAGSSVAVQFNGIPPVLAIVIGCAFIPVATLKLTPGPALSVGGASTFNVTPTACGLPVIAMPPSTAASEIEPVYGEPLDSFAAAAVTVKVVLWPLASVAEAGDTASQPVPLSIVTLGVTVTVPVQFPMTPIVKLCGAGFKPGSVEKDFVGSEGLCNVHSGCTVNATVTLCGVPTGFLVTLSTAVIVTVPE